MNDNAKLALAVGVGMGVGKLTNSSSTYWWILGGLTALFIFNSPSTQRAISSGASSLYHKVRS